MGILQQKREKWIGKWLDSVYSTYPSESARFFKDTKDPFSNPVGATLKTGLSDLYDAITGSGFDPDAAKKALGPVVKLRAVQEFSPAAAVGFIFELKTILQHGAGLPESETGEMFFRIDAVMLMAFDLYMENKKTIYTLRASQARDNVRQLLVKKDLICELPEIDPELTK